MSDIAFLSAVDIAASLLVANAVASAMSPLVFAAFSATGLVDFCQTVLNLNEFVYRP